MLNSRHASAIAPSVAPGAALKIRIHPYDEAHVPLVQAMNARIQAGGSRWAFYESARPRWIPADPADPGPSRSYFVAIGDDGEVHGGYCFKEQDFRIGTALHRFGTWQGPVSEGLVDRRFRKVGLQCLMDMADRNPLLYCWGGSDQLNALLEGLGWARYPTPFLVRMINPRRVLRQAPFIRGGRARARLANIAAASGLGPVAIGAAQAMRALVAGASGPAEAIPSAGFGDWSDAVEAASLDCASLVACRDARSLDRLMGRPGWPDAHVMRIVSGGRLLGWAATRLNAMDGDRRFGSLKLGVILDALALPGEERRVIATAAEFLAEEGADLLVGNVTHDRWRAAHASAGYLEIPEQRDLFLSPPVGALLAQAGINVPGSLHLMPIDGDGPFGL